MAADEFGGGVDYDVRTVLNGPDEIGGAEGVVDDQRQAVLVGDGGDGINVGDVAVGVAQGLQIDGTGVVLNGVLHLGQVVGVYKGGGHAEVGQGVLQQVIAAAVDGLLGYDVTAVGGQGLDGIGDGGGTGGHGQSGHAALQSRNALFKHVLSGVGQAAIDVACVGQTEPGGGMGGVMEHIRGGLIDGDGAGVGGGVGLLLTDVELQGLELIMTHE